MQLWFGSGTTKPSLMKYLDQNQGRRMSLASFDPTSTVCYKELTPRYSRTDKRAPGKHIACLAKG